MSFEKIFTQKSKTQQHPKDEVNVNRILDKYRETGLVSHVATRAAQYGDFSDVGTFQDVIHKVQAAQDLFDQIPSDIRKKFDNDPAKFIEFCSNPDNIDDLREMGLAVPAQVDEIQAADPPISPSPDED